LWIKKRGKRGKKTKKKKKNAKRKSGCTKPLGRSNSKTKPTPAKAWDHRDAGYGQGVSSQKALKQRTGARTRGRLANDQATVPKPGQVNQHLD